MRITDNTISVFDRIKNSRIKQERRRGEKARRLMMRAGARTVDAPYRYYNGENFSSFHSKYDLYEFAGSTINRRTDEAIKKNKEISAQSLQESPDIVKLDAIQKSGTKNKRYMAGSDDGKKHGVHVLSARSKAKIRQKTGAFFRIKGRTSTFVTLSFISAIEESDAVKLLNKFFVQVRKDQGDFNYIWVIERQENGNPHFHIIIDRRLSVVRYNSLWVMQQYNSGLIGYSHKLGRTLHRDEIIDMHEKTMQLIKQYRLEKDKKNRAVIEEKIKEISVGRFLNPFDIKKVYTVDGLTSYLTKYVTKNKGEFKSATWRCSRKVSELFTRCQIPYDVWMESTTEINYYVNKETGEYKRGEEIVVYKKNKAGEKIGFPVASIVYVYNKKHFNQYLRVLDKLNQWVFDDCLNPEFRRCTYDEYMKRVHNYTAVNN